MLAQGNSLFAYHQNENGIVHLRASKAVPEVPLLQPFKTLKEFYARIDKAIPLMEEHGIRNLVLESGTQIERTAFEECTEEQYKGKDGKEGFYSFHQGPNTVMTQYWPKIISKISEVTVAGFNVIMTGHTATKETKNVTGSDFLKYFPDMHEKSWKALKPVANIVILMDQAIGTKEVKGKMTKLADNNEPTRFIQWGNANYAEAKNQLNIEEEFMELDGTPAENWAKIQATVASKGYEI